MDSLDKKVIYYGGVQDMSWDNKEDLICFTSVKTTSSGLMSIEEFKTNYKYTGFNGYQPVYIHKDYKTIK